MKLMMHGNIGRLYCIVFNLGNVLLADMLDIHHALEKKLDLMVEIL